MLKKLRWKFVLINMGIVAAMLLSIFCAVFEFTKADLEQKSIDQVYSLMQGAPVRGNDRGLPQFTVQVTIFGEISVSGNSYYDLTDKTFIQDLIRAVYAQNETIGKLEEYNLRYGVVNGQGVSRFYFVDTSGHASALMSLVETGALIGGLSLLVFLGISILLARWAVLPVEKAWEQQKQFVSDASHELKTPLTVIMSNAELLQLTEYDEENKMQFSRNILTMSQQMRNLVESLLELARADKVKQNFALLELSELVEEALLPFEPALFEKGIYLESRVTPGIFLHGNEQYLKQLLDILLDNAMKYSAPGVVEVGLSRQGRNKCLLTVSNPGEPIPAQELERIFDRFYRTDKSRSRDGSFGLGLSIAKTVVAEHGGKIWAKSNETGNCFFVELPCE